LATYFLPNNRGKKSVTVDLTSAEGSDRYCGSPTSPTWSWTAELLYGTALLAEGGVPEDPAKFAGLLTDRLARTV
jgi:HSP90 family molecular chaperone